MERKNSVILCMTIAVIAFLLIGVFLGYLIPRDVHTQVIEASGKYVTYFDEMQKYYYPFNETDNVTMLFHGRVLLINHTIPNELGMRFFNIGFDNDGFPKYIAQYRDNRTK